jgi:hypothetical protein
MWWRKREDKHLVPLDDVAAIIEACAKMYEAGRKSAMPDIPPQMSLTAKDADDVLTRMQGSLSGRVANWIGTGEAGSGPTEEAGN